MAQQKQRPQAAVFAFDVKTKRCEEESWSSISFMDSCSTLGSFSPPLPSACSDNHLSKDAKENAISTGGTTPMQNLLAKRKKAMLRHSRSFDDTSPSLFPSLPRSKHTRPRSTRRRHKSTDDAATTPIKAEDRWVSQPEKLDQAPSHHTVIDPTTSSSRWDTNGSNSSTSRRSSISCPAMRPSRHDSSSDFFDVVSFHCDQEDARSLSLPSLPQRIPSDKATRVDPKRSLSRPVSPQSHVAPRQA